MHEKIENCLIQAKRNAREGNRSAAIDYVKEALTLDPGEMLITEVLLSLERQHKIPPVKKEIKIEKTTEPISTFERINSQPMDAKLEKIFQLSDKARNAGDDVKAIAYLKKARKLYPDNSDVEEKLQTLKTLVGASNLVLIGLKALDSDNIQKAIKASRKAFNLDPNANRLQELIKGLENLTTEASSVTEKPIKRKPKPTVQSRDNTVSDEKVKEEASDKEEDKDTPMGEELLWADRVRRAVQDDEFEEAGKMVTNAIKKFPHDELLNSFYSKLKRLGFAK